MTKEKDHSQHKRVKINILSADLYEGTDPNGMSDPYCRIGKDGKIGKKWITKTKVIQRTLKPNWNEEELFYVSAKKQKLYFEVWDRDPYFDDYMGTFEINAYECDKYVCHDVDLKKGSKVTGRLLFSISPLHVSPF
ncbi:hypothetical protein CYY_009384 [Polysphondylium violaceum]|uniref:C2 domain-containing protein n=1 Tax=Polysphondylium violaceum TaxID=133409 RepID=A0A8J4PLT8_9MYCE|nr:hypothetical protein CYY_009384 [Polysphondylium violaceum]